MICLVSPNIHELGTQSLKSSVNDIWKWELWGRLGCEDSALMTGLIYKWTNESPEEPLL